MLKGLDLPDAAAGGPGDGLGRETGDKAKGDDVELIGSEAQDRRAEPLLLPLGGGQRESRSIAQHVIGDAIEPDLEAALEAAEPRQTFEDAEEDRPNGLLGPISVAHEEAHIPIKRVEVLLEEVAEGVILVALGPYDELTIGDATPNWGSRHQVFSHDANVSHCDIRITPKAMYEFLLENSWIENRGAACTTAAVLAGLGALGASGLPDLAGATRILAGSEFGAPQLLDYVSWPGRRAPLDLRIEALAREHGASVRSRSGVVLPGWPLWPTPGEMLIVHLAYGQEAPGRYGAWGWNPVQPATYSTGGHSVVLAAVDGPRWTVLDSNLQGLQRWPRPGIATARTRLTLASR